MLTGINEEEEIKRLLESQYIDVFPPEHLKTSIMSMVEFIKMLKELGLLYTDGLLSVFRQ